MKKESLVILLSGGLDSAVCLAIYHQDYEIHALSLAYGQRHRIELDRARQLCDYYDVFCRMQLRVPLFTITQKPLISGRGLPEHRTREERSEGISPAFLPGRNALFLVYAMAYAAEVEAKAIVLGASAEDAHGFPDCRRAFFLAAEKMWIEATTQKVEIVTPLLYDSKKRILEKAIQLDVPLHMTHTCYRPNMYVACGGCDACKIRLEAFEALGRKDPIEYARR